MHQTSTIGGGSYCLLNIIQALDSKRFEAVVALRSDGPLVDELRKCKVEVIIFSQMTPIPYNKSLLKIKSIKAYRNADKSGVLLKKILREYKIDIMYLNNMMLCRYLKHAKEVGVKTIVHVREHWPFNEHQRQLKWARKCVYLYADRMIAINRYSAGMFPDKDSTIVYDWIDMGNRYEEKPFSEIFGEPVDNLKVYLYLGGLLNIKGSTQVLDAFMNLKDPNARLLVVGVDPTIKVVTFKDKIKSLLSKIGYNTYEYKVKSRIAKDSRIKCIPSTYNLAHIMEQSYCNLSYFTIPHANLAMAECELMGTPSIAARTDESDEYSLNGSLSVLYNLGDFSGFESSFIIMDQRYQNIILNLKERRKELLEMFLPEVNIRKIKEVINCL